VDDILIFDVYYTGKQIIAIFTVVVVVSCCRRCSCCYHSHYCDTYFEEQTKGVVHYYHWERGVGRDFVMLSHNRGGGSWVSVIYRYRILLVTQHRVSAVPVMTVPKRRRIREIRYPHGPNSCRRRAAFVRKQFVNFTWKKRQWLWKFCLPISGSVIFQGCRFSVLYRRNIRAVG